MNEIRDYFQRLRFDAHFHLGLGDVRLTIAMQDEICEMFEKELKAKDVLLDLRDEEYFRFCETGMSETISRYRRKEKMCELRESGWTLSDIGRKFHISRERVRQIVGNTGHNGHQSKEIAKRIKDRNDRINKYASNPQLTNDDVARLANVSLSTVVKIREGRHAINGGKAERGYVVENWVSDFLFELGIENTLMPYSHPFDIELKNGLRIDVKSSRPISATVDTPLYTFNVKGRNTKNNCQTDVFVLVIEDENGDRELFIVPKNKIPKTKTPVRFSWPEPIYGRKSKWHKYHNRFDLLEQRKE